MFFKSVRCQGARYNKDISCIGSIGCYGDEGENGRVAMQMRVEIAALVAYIILNLLYVLYLCLDLLATIF